MKKIGKYKPFRLSKPFRFQNLIFAEFGDISPLVRDCLRNNQQYFNCISALALTVVINAHLAPNHTEDIRSSMACLLPDQHTFLHSFQHHQNPLHTIQKS